MEYGEFVRSVRELPFIHDNGQAEAATKAVLAILAGRLEPAAAARLSERLPAGLELNALRDPQAAEALDAYTLAVSRRFDLDLDAASEVVDRVLESTRAAVGAAALREVRTALPPDWEAVLERA